MCSFSKEVKEEVMEMRKDIEKMKEESIAYSILKDQRRQNKRMFIIWLVTFIAFIGLLSYTIYLLNDITAIETKEETYDIEQNSGDGGNNNFINGNDNEVNNG